MKTVAVAVVIAVAGCAGRPPKTYEVTYLPDARITVDGRPEEQAWQKAALEDDFVFPWRGRDTVAPRTAFRALCDDRFLYFVFVVEDADVVVDAATEGEMALIAEDRVEFYFAPDLELQEYYCVEMDFSGRRLDYRAAFHRQFDFSWEFTGLETINSIMTWTVTASIVAHGLSAWPGSNWYARWVARHPERIADGPETRELPADAVHPLTPEDPVRLRR